jgi:hypothetical protein
MSETRSEFGEPWSITQDENDRGNPCSILRQSDGTAMTVVSQYRNNIHYEDTAERIRACVNFLAGVPTETLELISTSKPEYHETLKYQLGCVALAIQRKMI